MADPDDEHESGTARVGLCLDAGGARSAYQVGALEVLLPELGRRGERPLLQVGTSAGGLLTASMVATAHLDAEEQAAHLVRMLAGVTKKNVMQPLWRQVPEVAVRYVSETLGLGGFRLRGLFGTEPLARTLERLVDWDALHRNIADGTIRQAAVTATAIRTGQVAIFTEGRGEGPPAPPEHRFVPTRLAVAHLMASAAIPTLFPSVRVDEPAEAAGWYVDGATRRRRPISPLLAMGADRVVVIGTGGLCPAEPDPALDLEPVDLGDGAAALLGAVMDDPLRHDLRRLGEVNELAADAELAGPLDRHRAERGRPPYRVVPYVALAPEQSSEIGDLAMEVYRANHATVRGTLGDPDLQVMHRLMGSDSPLQGQLLSYLMFDPDFSDAAAALGRRDARAWLRAHPDLWRTTTLEAVQG